MILLKYLIPLTLVVFSGSTDCKKMFPGKWKYRNVSATESYVVRTLEKQLEYEENGKYYYEFKIRWISDCKYELTYTGTNSPKPFVANINETCTVEIIGIDNEYMKYKTIFRDQLDVSEMEKMK
jgi:hypothetical protein